MYIQTIEIYSYLAVIHSLFWAHEIYMHTEMHVKWIWMIIKAIHIEISVEYTRVSEQNKKKINKMNKKERKKETALLHIDRSTRLMPNICTDYCT